MTYENTERLYTLINKINRKLRNPKFDSWEKNIPGSSTTKVQWWILKILWEHKECTAGNLAKTIGVQPATMSQMLNRLENARLITRFAGVTDTRVRIIRLTEKGQDMFYDSEARFVEKLAEPLKHLTLEEQQVLIVLLEKLVGGFLQ